MVHESHYGRTSTSTSGTGVVSIKEILPGWVSIEWSRVRAQVIGYYVHVKDISDDDNPNWVQVRYFPYFPGKRGVSIKF